MSTRTYWIDEPWIMGVEYHGVVTNQDVDEVMSICIPAADKHPIAFLVDVSNAQRLDPNVLKSKSIIELVRHHNTRFFALVGVNPIIRIAVQFFMRFSSFKLFDDKDAALQFLKEQIEREKAMQ